MSFGEVVKWTEEHPLEATAIGGFSLIVIIWLFGGFGSKSSSSSSDSGAGTSALYAAEANQAAVGGQIQLATIQAQRDTAIAGLSAQSAVAIANAQAGAALTINAQNATRDAVINGQNVGRDIAIGGFTLKGLMIGAGRDEALANIGANRDLGLAGIGANRDLGIADIQAGRDINIAGIGAGRDVTLASDQLLASQTNDQAMIDINNSNNALADLLAQIQAQTDLYSLIYGKVVPQELTQLKGKLPVGFTFPGIGLTRIGKNVGVTPPPPKGKPPVGKRPPAQPPGRPPIAPGLPPGRPGRPPHPPRAHPGHALARPQPRTEPQPARRKRRK